MDKTAEQEWLRLGGRVVSLRPANIPTSSGEDEWWIERWMLMPEGNSSVIVLRDCSWSDFSGAAVYRDMLIAEYCDRLVAFQSDPPSSGTAITVGFAQAAEKPVYVYSPKARFAQAA